jgi:MFS family permease
MTEARPYQPSLAVWLSLAQLITWGSTFYMFALVMSPLERDLGVSRAESSLAFSLGLLAEGLMAYPVGRLIDRGHERLVMTLGSLLSGLCLLAHAGISSLVGLYLSWAALGASMAATLYAPAFAVVTRRFPGHFRRAIITMTFLGGLASTVFIPLIAWLVQGWGWRQALIVLAALQFLVCAPLHARVLRGAPRAARLAEMGAAHSPAPADVAAGGTAGGALRRHIFSAPFGLVGLFIVLLMAVTVALPAHMVSLLRENGLSEGWAIAIPASIGVVQVLGRLLLFFLEHRIESHRANRLISTLVPLSLLALLAAPLSDAWRPGLLMLFVVLYGAGNGLLTIVKGTAVAQYVDRQQAASLNGALGLPLALSRATAPWLLGVMWSAQAGYTPGIWLLLGLSLVALVALVLAQELARQRAG